MKVIILEIVRGTWLYLVIKSIIRQFLGFETANNAYGKYILNIADKNS
tara:strand:+ start:72 stop:215 length:144 start_codon:yes stop_codon:yes gene_type:complete